MPGWPLRTSSGLDIVSAEEPCYVGGVGVQGCPGLGVQRGERCQRDLAARDGPGCHGPAAGQRERPEQPVDSHDPPVRADDRVAGSPAEQQRIERAQQQWRWQRGRYTIGFGLALGNWLALVTATYSLAAGVRALGGARAAAGSANHAPARREGGLGPAAHT